MKASKIDKVFDENNEEVLDYFDTSNIRMINEEPRRVNIDFPAMDGKIIRQRGQTYRCQQAGCHQNVAGRKTSKS